MPKTKPPAKEKRRTTTEICGGGRIYSMMGGRVVLFNSIIRSSVLPATLIGGIVPCLKSPSVLFIYRTIYSQPETPFHLPPKPSNPYHFPPPDQLHHTRLTQSSPLYTFRNLTASAPSSNTCLSATTLYPPTLGKIFVHPAQYTTPNKSTPTPTTGKM